jgi:hypothetical protein
MYSGMRNRQHVQAIFVRLSDLQLRLAILYALLQSLRTVSTLVIGIALIAGVFALHLQGMVGATLFSSVTAGILIGLIGWIALNAVLFVANVKTANRVKPPPRAPGVQAQESPFIKALHCARKRRIALEVFLTDPATHRLRVRGQECLHYLSP